MPRTQGPPTVLAYHQVGTDSMESSIRAALLNEILRIGAILPATARVKRREMWEECFTPESQTFPLYARFNRATPKALAALQALASEVVSRLPEEGATHTLFNCVDVLAGDLDRVFLAVGAWFGPFANGFVFDAGQLISAGARVRLSDLFHDFNQAIRRASRQSYRSTAAATRAIQGAIERVLDERTLEDEPAILALHDCAKRPGTCELTWDGPLPINLAVEVWREGKLVR